MKKQAKLFISSAFIILTFLVSPVIHGAEGISEPEQLKTPSRTQLINESYNPLQVSDSSIESEQREKQRKLFFWNSGIDQNIQHIKDIQNYNLTYGELLRTLEMMEIYYTTEALSEVTTMHAMYPDIRRDTAKLLYICGKWWEKGGAANKLGSCLHSEVISFGNSKKKRCESEEGYRIKEAMNKCKDILLEVIAKKMEKYEEISGIPHPRKMPESEDKINLLIGNSNEQLEASQEESRKIMAKSIEKQEKLSFWSSGIDQNIQYIKDLHNYNLTYGELLKILEAIKAYYTESKLEINKVISRDPEIIPNDSKVMYLCTGCWRDGPGNALLNSVRPKSETHLTIEEDSTLHYHMRQLRFILIEIVTEKMGKYEALQGTAHPRQDEFSQM